MRFVSSADAGRYLSTEDIPGGEPPHAPTGDDKQPGDGSACANEGDCHVGCPKDRHDVYWKHRKVWT